MLLRRQDRYTNRQFNSAFPLASFLISSLLHRRDELNGDCEIWAAKVSFLHTLRVQVLLVPFFLKLKPVKSYNFHLFLTFAYFVPRDWIFAIKNVHVLQVLYFLYSRRQQTLRAGQGPLVRKTSKQNQLTLTRMWAHTYGEPFAACPDVAPGGCYRPA